MEKRFSLFGKCVSLRSKSEVTVLTYRFSVLFLCLQLTEEKWESKLFACINNDFLNEKVVFRLCHTVTTVTRWRGATNKVLLFFTLVGLEVLLFIPGLRSVCFSSTRGVGQQVDRLQEPVVKMSKRAKTIRFAATRRRRVPGAPQAPRQPEDRRVGGGTPAGYQ